MRIKGKINDHILIVFSSAQEQVLSEIQRRTGPGRAGAEPNRGAATVKL